MYVLSAMCECGVCVCVRERAAAVVVAVLTVAKMMVVGLLL